MRCLFRLLAVALAISLTTQLFAEPESKKYIAERVILAGPEINHGEPLIVSFEAERTVGGLVTTTLIRQGGGWEYHNIPVYLIREGKETKLKTKDFEDKKLLVKPWDFIWVGEPG
jgi:hypothetical protein